jgi:hypothetical protein
MLDAKLRRVIDPLLNRVGARLAHWGIGADTVTVAGFGIGVAGGQGVDVLENRGWDDLPERVIVVSYSASRSLRTAAI